MQRTISASIDAPAPRIYTVLHDLTTYPAWLDIVSKVVAADAAHDDAGPAWWVTLRAQVGPFARSKRLRMVRTRAVEPHSLRFERAEVDGRTHSVWALDAIVEGTQPCEVTVDLRYEGSLWTTPLEAVLGSQATDAVPRLQALVATDS